MWAAPTGVLQSLLCAGLCPTPFAVRVFPSTTSLDILRSLNAKKETEFLSKVIAQQLTLCASVWAASKLWLQLYTFQDEPIAVIVRHPLEKENASSHTISLSRRFEHVASDEATPTCRQPGLGRRALVRIAIPFLGDFYMMSNFCGINSNKALHEPMTASLGTNAHIMNPYCDIGSHSAGEMARS